MITANQVVVIHAIIVTEEGGKMKKTIIWTVVLIAPWVVICVLQLVIMDFKKGFSDFKDFLYPSLVALYTGFSVIVAFRNLIEEKNGLIRQTQISVFSEAMHLLAKDEQYQESLEYILSGACDKDIVTVKKILSKKKDIGLDNFWEILYENIRTEGVPVSEEDINGLKKSYDKIKYFCQRMEYLGVISEDKDAGSLIIKLYGDTIIDTYDKVRSLITNTEKNKSKKIYKYYTNLYKLAKENKE